MGSLSFYMNTVVLELQPTACWPEILLQNFLTEDRLHVSLNNSKSSWPWSGKASPQRYAATSMLDHGYNRLVVESLVCGGCNGTFALQTVQQFKHHQFSSPRSWGSRRAGATVRWALLLHGNRGTISLGLIGRERGLREFFLCLLWILFLLILSFFLINSLNELSG